MEIKTDDESNGLCGSQLLLDRPIILTINHTNTKINANTNKNANANTDRSATISTYPMKEIDN